ncbi:hypothetical protein CLOM_g9506 [Closterium sp. NIES-68]|nr:hypothetical protein CLOM_g9506 [Closterium sp. NIES-68]GJP69541.1 hypothetical protein CLOP_g545 [Closterium sp. NIES-67]
MSLSAGGRVATAVLPKLPLFAGRSCSPAAVASSLNRLFSAGPAGSPRPPRPSSDYPSRPPPPEAMPIIEPGQPIPGQTIPGEGEGAADDGSREGDMREWARDAGRMQEVFGGIREHRVDTVGRVQPSNGFEANKALSGRLSLAQLKELLALHVQGGPASSGSAAAAAGVSAAGASATVDAFASHFSVDAALLARVLVHVRMPTSEEAL